MLACLAPLRAEVPRGVDALFEPVRGLDAKVKVLPDGWTNDGKTLAGRAAKDAPVVVLAPVAGVWDASGFSYVQARIANHGRGLVWIEGRLESAGATDWSNSQAGTVVILPGETATLGFALARPGNTYAGPAVFKSQSAKPDGHRSHWRMLDPSRVTGLRLAIRSAAPEIKLGIPEISLAWPMDKAFTAALDELPYLDEFGQVRQLSWPGKLADAAALQRALAEELAAPVTRPPGWNRFGGWADGPRRRASGFFRTEKHDGKWWLVDPDGALFWSQGANSVGVGAPTPATDDRRALFAWLPAAGEPLHAVCMSLDRRKEPVVDFAMANAWRAFGADWEARMSDLTHRRLSYWGMNTLGGWSDTAMAKQARTPYTLATGVWWPILANDGHVLPDPFEPGFASSLRGSLRGFAWAKADPWCIGVFIDNELDWPDSIADKLFSAGPKQAARVWATGWLVEKYKTMDALNAAWGTSFASWEAFSAVRKLKVSPSMQADMDALYAGLAEKYYRTCKEIMREEMPNHLYLGSRIHKASPIAIKAAVRHVDVLSLNRYESMAGTGGIPADADIPVMITEYHFGAPDRGVPGIGLRGVHDQTQRARAFAGYTAGGLVDRRVVGAHWFCYQDQSAAGRPGENYQVGLVDVTNRPYAGFVRTIRQVANNLYPVRASVDSLTPVQVLDRLLASP